MVAGIPPPTHPTHRNRKCKLTRVSENSITAEIEADHANNYVVPRIVKFLLTINSKKLKKHLSANETLSEI